MVCNFISYLFLGFYYKIRAQEENKKPNIVVLSDYLNTTLMLDSLSNQSFNVFLLTTKRYNFYNLILKKRYKKIKKIKLVSDYSDTQRKSLLKFCQGNHIEYAFLQSGDFMVPMVNFLNRNLNGKGNSEFAVQCSLNKNKMREALNKKNISFFKKLVISKESDLDLIDFLPAVLKPAVGTASEGVVLIDEAAKSKRAYQNSKKSMRKTEFNTVFIAEEYVEGRQFDVEGVIHEGKVYILCIVEENYEGFFPNFDINWFFFNVAIQNHLLQKINHVVTAALNACEIKHGAFHCELRINEKNEVKILEFSNRMGGGFEQPISDITGTNFCDIYINSMLDQSIEIKNKGTMLFDKYFKDSEDFKRWRKYLDQKKISYQYSVLLLPNNKFRVSIKTDNIKVIYDLSDHFFLNIEKI